MSDTDSQFKRDIDELRQIRDELRVKAHLGRLEATNHWRGILAEYRSEAEPCTEMGRLEAAWLADRRGW